MIYCPHCKKPSARKTGACPHCGIELTAPKGAGPPVTAPPAMVAGQSARQAQTATASGLVVDQMAVPQPAPANDLTGARPSRETARPSAADSGRGSGLELIDVPRRSGAGSDGLAPVRPIDDFEVQDVAGFGTPSSGAIGAIRYWLWVYRRKKALAALLADAETEHVRLNHQAREALAQLGRRAHQLSPDQRVIQSAAGEALKLQADLKGLERERVHLESEHQAQLKVVDEKMAAAEVAAEPFREQARQARAALEAIETDHKRHAARLKRIQIELRNLDNLIERRSAQLEDQKSFENQRQIWAEELSASKQKRAGLVEQLQSQQAELAALDEPILEARQNLDDASARLRQKTDQISAVVVEREALMTAFSDEAGTVVGRVEAEVEKVASAWAQVGLQALKLEPFPDELARERSPAIKKEQAAREAARTVKVLTQAMTHYDVVVVKRAQRTTMMIGAGAVLAIVALAIFL